ncbi:MAG: hypothetical protein ACK55H_04470 [Cyanobacteriota bacterium]|jgi:hypothetical protein
MTPARRIGSGAVAEFSVPLPHRGEEIHYHQAMAEHGGSSRHERQAGCLPPGYVTRFTTSY